MSDTVELDIIFVSMAQFRTRESRKKVISREKFKKLCSKYGTYGFSWYYTECGLKYFDGEWHYE